MRHVLENYGEGEWNTRYRSARIVEKFVGPEIWKSYFKFAIVRNPFSRMVSWYKNVWEQIESFKAKSTPVPKKYKQFIKDAQTFESFILRAEVFDRGKCESFYYREPQIDFLSDNSGIGMDYIVKLENISEEWPNIVSLIGLPNIAFPHMNKSKESDYREWYDDKLKRIMLDRFKKDFDTFGYSIPQELQ